MKTCPTNQGLISLRNLQACLVILALFLLMISPGKATTWYVSQTTGSDTTGTGTSGKPYQTIGKAVSVALTSDTIDVGDGNYNETVGLTHGGTATAPFTLQNWPGQGFTITGMTQIASTAWAVYSGTGANTIYSTTVGSTASPWVARDLFISDEPTAIAKTAWETISTCTGGGAGTTYTITVPSMHLNFTGGVDSSFIYIDNFSGTHTTNSFLTYYITSLTDNGTTTTITFTGDNGSPDINPGTDTITVCNHPTLVTQNTWCYVVPPSNTNETTLYYDPSLASDLNSTFSRKNDYCLTIWGLNYVNVNNATIKGALLYGARVVSNSSNVTFDKCTCFNCGEIGAISGYGMLLDTDSNVTLKGCVFTTNLNGLSAVSQTNLTVEQSLICYNYNDGFDVGADGGVPTDGLDIEQCYFHHNTFIDHADDLQFDQATENVTVDSSCLAFSGQNIIGTVSTSTLSNDVFLSSYAINLNTSAWTMKNDTCLFSKNGAVFLTGNSIVNSLFYHAYIPYDGETSSDYNLFWNNGPTLVDAIATVAPNTKYTTVNVNDSNLYNKTGYEQHSTGVAPMLNNIPQSGAYVQNNPVSTLPSNEILIQPLNNCTLSPDYFKIGDVLEINADGIARSITASTPSGNGLILTLSPAGNCWHIGAVWDWPAGTTNLAIDTRPATGSPAASGGSTGGERGSNINLVQFAAGEFDGTGTVNIPVPGSNITTIWSHLNNFPYYGPTP